MEQTRRNFLKLLIAIPVIGKLGLFSDLTLPKIANKQITKDDYLSSGIYPSKSTFNPMDSAGFVRLLDMRLKELEEEGDYVEHNRLQMKYRR